MDATIATFDQDVIERSREDTVVVAFWAARCGPCRAAAPAIGRLLDGVIAEHGAPEAPA
jgi:putative thioredoxin